MVKYGLNQDSDYYAKNIEINERGSEFDVVIPRKENILRILCFSAKNILRILCFWAE